MTSDSSLEILQKFLSDQKIKTDTKKLLKSIIIDSDDTVKLSTDIVPKIITDAYDDFGKLMSIINICKLHCLCN